MIDVKQVSFRYAKSKEKVFDNFGLSIEKGHIYGLLGKNGAGKSTLLYLLSGLLRPMSGEVLFEGEPVCRRTPRMMQDIFVLPDEDFALPAVSLTSFVKYNKPFYPNFDDKILHDCLQIFEMPSEIVHLDALSHGQKKKVYISFALATQTRLLLMDEPTNGLDIPSKSSFRKALISGMSEDKTIIISTHQVRDVENMLDHVLLIDNSHVLLNADTSEITRKLSFKIALTSEQAQRALFAQPTIQGNYIVEVNETGEETEINMEALFNAVLLNPQKIHNLFNA